MAARGPDEVIRVVIADDHHVVRSGLERLLEGWPNVSVVGVAADGAEAVRLVSLHQPDIVLMDISMPTMGGVEATRRIVAAWPAIQVVVLTSFDDRLDGRRGPRRRRDRLSPQGLRPGDAT